MDDKETSSEQKIQVRRYPNRRYYSATHSRHVTLEAIYQLILDGNDVEVTDSKTGEDITTKVLTQIILEHEAPKLDVFPADLLHRLIRTNEPLVREFVEKYFSQAFSAFVDSQQQFTDYLREAMGLRGADTASWPQAVWGPFASTMFGKTQSQPNNKDEGNGKTNHDDSDLRQSVQQLQEQVLKLQEELNGR